MKQLVSTHELAGNYTVVVDTVQNNVYLDALDNDRQGITMNSCIDGSLMMDVSDMFRNYNINVFPNVYEITDNTTSSSELYNNYNSVKYRARICRTNDNNLRIFAPFIMQEGDQIPDVFVLYRYDLSQSEKTKSIAAIVNLHTNKISDYIQPKNFSYAYIHGNKEYIKGIDSNTGQFVKADIYSDSIKKDESATENLIYASYRDKKILFNNIINLSFVIKDDDIYSNGDKTSAYLYCGRYANVNKLGELQIEGYWGSENDNRSNIFIYRPSSDSNIHNRIELIGECDLLSKLKQKDETIVMLHHDETYEQPSFDDFGANVKYGNDQKQKYIELERTTFSIDSYETKNPSMTFELPTSDSSLSILMSLKSGYTRYLYATNRIDIKWSKTILDTDDEDTTIVIGSSIDSQFEKLKSLLSPYFKLSKGKLNNKTIITLTARNDNILDFNKLKFLKTSRLNTVGIYKSTDTTPDIKNVRNKVIEYEFTSEGNYAKISNETSSDFSKYAKSLYIELSGIDIDNTSIHDNVHEMFSDEDYTYVKTTGYLENGEISGNVLSFYSMKHTNMYTLENITIGDFIDIRTLHIGDNTPEGIVDDSMPVDIKTRIGWCDYSSVNKDGDNLLPSVAGSTGVIDIDSSIASSDGWSYGQLLYNGKYDDTDIHFYNTHFSSKEIEDAYILSVFDDCFKNTDTLWYVSHRVDFVRVVMTCMCYVDESYNPSHAPLLLFDEYDANYCVVNRVLNYLNSHSQLKRTDGDSVNELTDDQIKTLVKLVGDKMNDELSIRTANTAISSYLENCDSTILNSITIKVSPVLYEDNLFCMLFGIPFTTNIDLAEYSFKSIIVPVPRFKIKLAEDTKVYDKSITKVILNNNAKTVIIATYIDIPCIMPFSMNDSDTDDYNDVTMFGILTRSLISKIGVEGYTPSATEINNLSAFDCQYINAAESLGSNVSYSQNDTYDTSISFINYMDSISIDNLDIIKDIIHDDAGNELSNDSNIFKVISAIAEGTGINLAIVGHSKVKDPTGADVQPDKFICFDKSDSAKSLALSTFYTLTAPKGNCHPIAYKDMLDANDGKVLTDGITAKDTKDKSESAIYRSAVIVPYDAAFNNGVRIVSNDRDLYFVASKITNLSPSKIDNSFKENWINSLKNILVYGSAFYYYNSLINDSHINEYTSNTDTFIETKNGSLNSAIINTFKADCYPSSNQMLIYDIVDEDSKVNSSKYIYLKSNNPIGKLYEQYISSYNSVLNKIVYQKTYENIFDITSPLNIDIDDEGNKDSAYLNYRTQRFMSLVIYDERFISDAAVIETNLDSSPSILESKYYISDGKWINYKNNRSSVDIKLYPSILYGAKLYPYIIDYINTIKTNDSVISKDQVISYVDSFMFYLYDYELNAYANLNTSEFVLVTNTDSATFEDYDTKKKYSQEYKNAYKSNTYFTFNMSLRK